MARLYASLQEARDSFYDKQQHNHLTDWKLSTSQAITNCGLGTRFIEVWAVVIWGSAVTKIIEYVKTDKGWCVR